MKQEADEATHAKIKTKSIFPMTMCNMICNYEFMMKDGYDTMNIAEVEISCQCRSIDFYLHSTSTLVHIHVHIHYSSSRNESAALDDPYKKTTLPKYHLFQKNLPTKKGFQDEKVVPVVAKAVRRGFFRHSHGSCRKNLVFFYKKLVAFL